MTMKMAETQAREEALAVLTGYCSTHPESNAGLQDPTLWQSKAAALLDARQFEILQAFSPETLTAIADGRLDMAAIYDKARAVAQAA